MPDNPRSPEQFQHVHAREQMMLDARRIGERQDADLLGPHLASAREAHRLMLLVALAAVAALAGAALVAV